MAITLGAGAALLLLQSGKKSYAKKPAYTKKKTAPKETYAKIECRNGSVQKGECVCEDDENVKSYGDNKYACEKAEAKVAEEPAPVKPAAPAPVANLEYAPDQILSTFPNSSPATAEQSVAAEFGLEVLDTFKSELADERVVLYRIKNGQPVDRVLANLRNDQRMRDPQPNYYYEQQGGAGAQAEQQVSDKGDGADGGNDLQYALSKMELSEAQGLARGRGVLIALIDSLVDTSNRELQAGIAGTIDVTRKADNTLDSHSTAIASILIANGSMRGVAPEAKLLCVRAVSVVAREGEKVFLRADSYGLSKGVELALAQNARILVMPLLGRHDPHFERVLQAASARQAVIIAPAGNGGPSAPPAYPGAYDAVIAVTAIDADDQLFEQANQGSYVSLAAPGVDVLVLNPGRGHSFLSGTSLAAAHVAGVAALMLGYDPQLPAERVRSAMIAASTDLGPPGRDQKFGAGRISALSALRQVKPTPVKKDLAKPAVAPSPPAQGPVSVGSIGSQRIIQDRP